MNHNHHDCSDHTLKLCAKCDIVYCAKCDKEWSRKYGYNFTGGLSGFTSAAQTNAVLNTANTVTNHTNHAN